MDQFFKKKCEFLALTGIFQKENETKLNDLNTPPVSSSSDIDDSSNLESKDSPKKKIKLKKIFFDKIPVTFSKKKEFCYKIYDKKIKINREIVFKDLNKFQKSQLVYDYEKYCSTGLVINNNNQQLSIENHSHG